MVDHQLIHELFPSGEIVSEVEQVVGCFACSKPLSGFSYRCRNCPALLHEKCANLPTLISNHALHRRHSLKLFMDPLPNYSGRNYCKLCFSRINGKLAYRCVTDCKFILDINCATLPKFLVGSFPEQQHFSHEHPLVSIDDHVDEAEINTCNSCKMSIPGGPINVCLQCDFWLHCKCFDLPQKTSHPRHRKHPLMLVVASSVLQSNINRVCGVCDKRIWEWSFYHCHFCKFDIHVDCAFLPWILKSEAHPHSFDLLLRKCKFMSDGCGRKVQGAPYLCIECNLVQHKDFFDMPHSIKVAQHHHKLVHTFSTSTIEELDEIEYCRMCHNELNPRYAHYCCIECNYVAHRQCVLDRDLRKLPFVSDSLHTNSSLASKEARLLDGCTHDYDSSEEKWAKILEFETVREGLTRPKVIQHVKHDEPLYWCQRISIDEDEDIRCYACCLPITDSYMFRCVECCQFFLHETCAFLERKLEHWIHPHTLTLEYEDIIVCQACKYEIDSFYYICDLCDFSICLRCTRIRVDIEHPGHIHPIFFDTRLEDPGHIMNPLLLLLPGRRWDHTCNACGNSCGASINRSFAFTCKMCRFFLDYSCLVLPEIAPHAYHNHLLTLSFEDNESNPDRMVCNICEENRNPTHWFYKCKDCEFTPSYFKAHTKCVLGKHPFIKIGNTFTTDAHEHVLKTISVYDYPECGGCKEVIEDDDIALVCQESDCNFMTHWKCPT